MAIEELLISVDEPDVWEHILSKVPHGYWHSWRASHALQLTHGLPTFLYSCRDRATGHRAVCVYSERRWRDSVDIFTSAGFSGFTASGPVQDLREHWREHVQRRGYVCGYFALHPKMVDKSAHENLHRSNTLYILDAGKGAKALLADSDSNVKRSLKRWAKSGQQYVEDRDLLADFVLRNYRAFMQQKDAASSVLWSNETLECICSDPAVLMVGVRDQQGLCIVGSFATSPYAAEYQFNVNVRAGRQHTAAVIFWGLQKLEQMNIRWLNLGGGIKPNDSVAQAKERYGPKHQPLFAAKEIYDQSRYRQLCLLAGQDPQNLSGFFPPYRLNDKSVSLSGVRRTSVVKGSV